MQSSRGSTACCKKARAFWLRVQGLLKVGPTKTFSFPSGVLEVCFSTRERRSAARRDSTLRPPGAGPAGPCPLNRPAGRRVPPPVACPRRAAVLRAVTEPPERGGGSRGVASASCTLEPALTGRIAQRTKVRARGPGDRGSSPGRALPRRACRWASYGHCPSARARRPARHVGWLGARADFTPVRLGQVSVYLISVHHACDGVTTASASCRIRAHDFPLTKRVLCQLS